MENQKNVDANYGEIWRALNEKKGMPKIICEILKIKRRSPFERDALSIYRNGGVNWLLMRQSEWSVVTLVNEASHWTRRLVV